MEETLWVRSRPGTVAAVHETILHEYKAGVRRGFTTSLVVWSAVSAGFAFAAFHAWRKIALGDRSTECFFIAPIMTILPCISLGYLLTNRPRSFRLIRNENGLFLRWRSGSEARVRSTSGKVSSFVLDKDYGNPYGTCVVKTDTRRGRTKLCFHEYGEAMVFAERLLKQKGRH